MKQTGAQDLRLSAWNLHVKVNVARAFAKGFSLRNRRIIIVHISNQLTNGFSTRKMQGLGFETSALLLKTLVVSFEPPWNTTSIFHIEGKKNTCNVGMVSILPPKSDLFDVIVNKTIGFENSF